MTRRNLHETSWALTALLLLSMSCASKSEPNSIVIDQASADQCARGGVVIVMNGETHIVCNGDPGADGDTPAIEVNELPPGHHECPAGGHEIVIDGDAHLVCSGEGGAPGAAGAQGADGTPGAKGEDGVDGTDGTHGVDGISPEVVVTTLERGEGGCPNGGIAISIDGESHAVCNGEDGDGGTGSTISIVVLDENEGGCQSGGVAVTVDGETHAICHGEQGEQGEPGASPVVSFEILERNEDVCPYGGVAIIVNYVPYAICNGADGHDGADGHSPTVTMSPLSAGDARCPFGGYVVTIVSSDADGQVMVNEVAVCHGAGFDVAVDWCQLVSPESADIEEGETFGVRALMHRDGVSGGCAEGDCARPEGLIGQAGIGPQDSTPHANSAWTWTGGVIDVDWEGDGSDTLDRFIANIGSSTAGEYDFVFRFSLNAGVTWTYCSLAGSDQPYDPMHAGKLTVEVKPGTVPYYGYCTENARCLDGLTCMVYDVGPDGGYHGWCAGECEPDPEIGQGTCPDGEGDAACFIGLGDGGPVYCGYACDPEATEPGCPEGMSCFFGADAGVCVYLY